ncbi:ER membrane protein complex subunit 1 [Anoplophora glabripennis]|uniref:ER membrane protein complex subunit 1 n=1 Tax=Anoplophora glabripennis TaxID=217634 RepID=UPI00087406A6|nr:ER membrane protein complex subunit 1 [Anoplophora glabripennis]
MASFRSICIISVFIILNIYLTSALYEDQVGKFDWKRSFIGKVKYANFDSKRLIVATEENVLASLNVKNGQILWRQFLENPKVQQIEAIHVDAEIITVSGAANNWFVRSWDLNTGTLLSEWTLNNERIVPNKFIIYKDTLIHVVLFAGSHLEATNYNLRNGENEAKVTKISAPWITSISNCLVTQNYFACISSNDNLGQLYYVDLTLENSKVYTRSIQSLIGDGPGTVQIVDFGGGIPAFLLLRNNVAILVHVDGEKVEVKPFNLMPNAVGVLNNGRYFIYQLEATENPEKLIRVKSKDFLNGLDEFSVDLDYPLGLGAPVILASQCKGSVCDLLLTTTDDALLLVRLPEGKILWTREEALSNIVATEFFELPVSELDVSIENEFKTSSNSILNMLVHRLSTQVKQLTNLIFGGQLLTNHGLVRDEFGLHKIIVVATKVGKLFAIDTLTGSIAWSYRLPNIKPFNSLNSEEMLLLVQRTARYAPLPAQCVLLAQDAVTKKGVMFQFDPITGISNNGIHRLDYKISQTMLVPHEDENNLKSVIVLSTDNKVFIYPDTSRQLAYQHRNNLFMYVVNSNNGILAGYNFRHSTEDVLKVTPIWNINVTPSKLVAVKAKHSNERVHSQGRVLPDRSVYYKYVNPNLIAVASISEDPIHKHVLNVYLVDGVTGFVLYSTSHKRAKEPIHLVHSENWLVYSYFSERFRRTEVVSVELYEGIVQSNSSVFSSHAISSLPHALSQSYILPANPLKMAVTLTERGITNKFLLIALSNGGVIEIPWLLLQPRFDDVPCGPEESCIPYMPEIPLPSEAVINYNQTLGNIRGIEIAPARLESTSHVLIHGLDLFYTKVAPSKTFDVLKEDFDHLMIVLVLAGLILASYITKHLASRKALKQIWK